MENAIGLVELRLTVQIYAGHQNNWFHLLIGLFSQLDVHPNFYFHASVHYEFISIA